MRVNDNSRKERSKIKSRKRRRKKIVVTLAFFVLTTSFVLVKFKLLPSAASDEKLTQSDNNHIIDKTETEEPKEKIGSTTGSSIELNKDEEEKESKPIFARDLLTLKETIIDKDGELVVTNPKNYLVVTNKDRGMPSDFIPNDLVVPNVPFPFDEFHPKKQMRKVAADALEELFKKSQEEGVNLYAISGYRSYTTQETLFQRSINLNGLEHTNKYLAKPGHSEHQTGLTMDVTTASVNFDVVTEFENTIEGIWLKDNSYKFGFIIRYPKDKEDITKYSYEPWHIRYVGKDVSEVMHKENLCLEEFFEKYVN